MDRPSILPHNSPLYGLSRYTTQPGNGGDGDKFEARIWVANSIISIAILICQVSAQLSLQYRADLVRASPVISPYCALQILKKEDFA